MQWFGDRLDVVGSVIVPVPMQYVMCCYIHGFDRMRYRYLPVAARVIQSWIEGLAIAEMSFHIISNHPTKCY